MEPVSSLWYYLEYQKQMSASIETAAKLCNRSTIANGKESLRSNDPPLLSTGRAELQPPAAGDSLPPPDIHRLLVDASEEMQFDWPEFLSVERIRMGMAEISLGFVVLVGLIALGTFFLLCPTFLS